MTNRLAGNELLEGGRLYLSRREALNNTYVGCSPLSSAASIITRRSLESQGDIPNNMRSHQADLHWRAAADIHIYWDVARAVHFVAETAASNNTTGMTS